MVSHKFLFIYLFWQNNWNTSKPKRRHVSALTQDEKKTRQCVSKIPSLFIFIPFSFFFNSSFPSFILGFSEIENLSLKIIATFFLLWFQQVNPFLSKDGCEKLGNRFEPGLAFSGIFFHFPTHFLSSQSTPERQETKIPSFWWLLSYFPGWRECIPSWVCVLWFLGLCFFNRHLQGVSTCLILILPWNLF